jgi:hypothetical protein
MQRLEAEAFEEHSNEVDHWVTETLKLPLPQEPRLEATFPDDIGACEIDELSGYLTTWTHVCGRASLQVAKIESLLIRKEAEYEERVDMSVSTTEGKSLADRKIQAKTKTNALKLSRHVEQLRADLVIAKALLSGYEKKYNTVSREISRRRMTADGFGT